MRTTDFIRSTPALGWVILYASLAIGIFGNLLGILTPRVQAHFALDYPQMSFLMSLITVGSLFGAILGGDIAKRFDQRILLLIYTSIMLILVLTLVNTQSYWLFVLAYTGMGVLDAALFTIAHSLLARMSQNEEHRTRMLSLADVGFSFGALFAPVWVSLILNWKSEWQQPYLLFTGFMVILLVAFSPKRFYPATSESHAVDSTANTQHSNQLGVYLKILRQPIILLVLAAYIFLGFVEWGQSFWLTSYVTKGLNLSETSANTSIFFLMLGMLIGRVWHAFLASRWSAQQKLQGLAILCLFGVITQNSLGLNGWVNTAIYLFWGCSFLVGLGMSVAFPILLGQMIELFPEQASRLSALSVICISIGSSIAALLVGYLAEWMGMRLAFTVFILAALAYVIFVTALLKQRKREAVIAVLS
ncbi:sugar MFS transporter [uncultured Thiothrix sp.]|uniref:MFS transporter n=1 Tax=uncultured Thiothrix sp. TaxID=223185 RepID=UPI00261C86ED|nr:MFS transporter [uncultured Thiothrix sp.]